ncbi:MAG: 8-oxo-dGTP diphosphatase MutT [Granulosicoccus sp.]|nr:8-oxo-dGTP diphosphatase MutT [Granulosicoccus sp.]
MIVEVVAGIIPDHTGRRFLLALRKPHQHQGDKWEFPGGKLEADESAAEGLQRELLEEIGIHVTDSVARLTIDHDYPDKNVRLHFRDVLSFNGEPQGREGQELRWVSIEELSKLSFPEANQTIVDQLIEAVG